MYRIRVANSALGDVRAKPIVVAQADVIVKNRLVPDQWQVHAQGYVGAAWELFDITWEPGARNLLRLVAIIAMHMGRADELTLAEVLRRRSAYQPGCQLTVDMGSRHPEAIAWLDINRLVDQRATYHVQWRVIGAEEPLTYKISYKPERFDLWALLMRASLLLGVRKYAPRVGVCHG